MAHNGGRLQVNISNNAPYHCPMFLNVMKQAISGISASSNSDNEWPALIDQYGYPTAMPAGAGARWFMAQIWIYGDVGDQWELWFPPQHDVWIANDDASTTISETTIAAGHKRYTITAAIRPALYLQGQQNPSTLFKLWIFPMAAPFTWVGGITLCAYKLNNVVVDHKSLLDAGEIFSPAFLKYLGYPNKSFGKIRFMDLQATNSAHQAKSSHSLSPGSISYWQNLRDVRFFQTGGAIKTRNDYVSTSRVVGSPGAYSRGTSYQFFMPSVPTAKVASTLTAGAVTTVPCVGHGFSNGDRIFFMSGNPITGSWSSEWYNALIYQGTNNGKGPDFVVTVVDANTFTIPLNSTGFPASATSFYVAWIVTFSDGVLPPKRCYRMTWDNHLGNEFTGVSLTAPVTGVYHDFEDGIIWSRDENSIFAGMPVEILCAMCNKIKAHPYFCVPPTLRGSELQLFYQKVKDNLDTDLTPDFELANEIWNTFPAQSQCAIYALMNGQKYNHQYGMALLTKEMQINAAAVFGVRPYRIGVAYQNVKNPYAFGVPFRGVQTHPMTITIGVSATITWVGHGMVANQEFAMSTMGALPGGVADGSPFFVKTVLTPDTFTISLTPGGGAITTYGTQSGSHFIGKISDYLITNHLDFVNTAPYANVRFTYSATANLYAGWEQCITDWKNGLKSKAFNWFAGQYATGLASGPGVNTDTQPLDTHIDTWLPEWMKLTAYMGRQGVPIEINSYEGCIHTVGPDSVDGGFPSGVVTVADVRDFYFEFFESYEYAQFVTKMYQQMYDLGVRFPSVYGLQFGWGNSGNWGIQSLRYQSDAYGDSPTKALIAAQNWNKGYKRFTLGTPV